MLTPEQLEASRFPLPRPQTEPGFSAKPDKSAKHAGKGPRCGTPSWCRELGGRDSNPEWQGQNLQCCRLHHPERASQRIAPPAAQPGCPARPDRAKRCSTRTRRRNPITRATPTWAVSVTMWRKAEKPVIGLVRVGEVADDSPSSAAMPWMRAAWKGSETRTTSVIPRWRRNRAADDSDSHDERPVASRRIASSGTPLVWR